MKRVDKNRIARAPDGRGKGSTPMLLGGSERTHPVVLTLDLAVGLQVILAARSNLWLLRTLVLVYSPNLQHFTPGCGWARKTRDSRHSVLTANTRR